LYLGLDGLSKRSKIVREIAAAIINFGLVYIILFSLYRFNIIEMFSQSIMFFDALLSFILILCLRLFNWNGINSVRVNPVNEFVTWVKSIWKRVLGNGFGFALPIAIIVGAYMGLNKIVFGTFTPVSGQIKTWWSTLPNTVYSHPNSVVSVLGLSDASNYGPWSIITAPIQALADFFATLTGNSIGSLKSLVFLILIVLLMIILVIVLKSNNGRLLKKIHLLFIPAVSLGCLLQISYYAVIGYQHTRGWYWLAEVMVVTLVACVLLDGLFTWLDAKWKRVRWSPIVAGALIIGLAAMHISYIVTLAPAQVTADNQGDYISEVRELESLTPEGSKIGMTGGGNVAYFIRNRTIINLDGLINSVEYFHAIKNGVGRDFLDAIPLNFVYSQEYVVTESDPYKVILGTRLTKIGVIKGFENFTLFNYVINQ
jgi:hypothetical protein